MDHFVTCCKQVYTGCYTVSAFAGNPALKFENLKESIKLHSVDFAETWKIRLTFWRCFKN